MQRHEHWQHLSRNSIRHTRSTYCNRWASHSSTVQMYIQDKRHVCKRAYDTYVYQGAVPEWDK